MFDELFLEDRVDDWTESGGFNLRGVVNGTDEDQPARLCWTMIGALEGSVADVLTLAPEGWRPASESLSDIDAGVQRAVAKLAKRREVDPSVRVETSLPPGLFHGSTVEMDSEDVRDDPDWSPVVTALAAEDDAARQALVAWFDDRLFGVPNWPVAFQFTGETDRWERVVPFTFEDDRWDYRGEEAEPDFIHRSFGGITERRVTVDLDRARSWLNVTPKTSHPDVNGLVVGFWLASADPEKRRTLVADVRFMMVHHVDLADIGDVEIARYPGLGPGQSFLRAVVLTAVIERLDFPPSWEASKVERVRAELLDLHKPYRRSDGGTASPSLGVEVDSALDEYRARRGRSGSDNRPRTMPAPRLIKNARAAEEYAAEVLEALGLTSVQVTPVGTDGGVDVWAAEAVVQVKMEGVSTGRPIVQALHGVASLESRAGIMFSLAGYTADALAWAERAGVACFEFELDGSVVARTSAAQQLLE